MEKKKLICVLLLAIGVSVTLITTKYYSNNKEEIIVKENNESTISNAMAFKVEQEDGSYKLQNEIPSSGYVFNQSESQCSNGAIPNWENNKLFLSNLTKSGTSCYLAFDKLRGQTSETIIEKIESAGSSYKGTTSPTFGTIATGKEVESNNGIYKVLDPMYGGNKYSYYWRGAAETNHVIFANKCWRIIRINGDKTIRLIYNGVVQTSNTCKGNGSNADSVIMGSTDSEKYYATSTGLSDKSYYVGWTYGTDQRTTSGTASNAKTQTEKWYKNNIGDNTTYNSHVADGKFCNDRDVGQPFSSWGGYVTDWSVSGTQFAYAGLKRLDELHQPTLECPIRDVYTLKVGAITADEVEFAGGGSENKSYYLYTGKHYWTMSPYQWDGTWARVFIVHAMGTLTSIGVSWTGAGLRPVINLRSDTLFNVDSDGTQNNPYVVLD